MNGPKPDKLDNLIMQVFQEEAEKIAVPPSTLLWDNLQQQLENWELRKMEDEQSQQQDPGKIPYLSAYKDAINRDDKAKKAKTGISPLEKTSRKQVKTWKKRRYLAGLVAACLVLIVIFAGSPEDSWLQNYFSQFLPALEKNQSLKLSIRDLQTDESAPEDALGMGESKADHFSGKIQTYSAEEQETSEEESNELFAERRKMPDEQHPGLPEQSFSLGAGQGQQNEENLRIDNSAGEGNKTFVEIAGIEPEKGPEDIYWHEEEGFLNSLANFRGQTSSRILCFAGLPDEYSFQVGTVTKTGHFLQKIYQEFKNKNGSKLTLSQLFYEEETAATEAVEAAKEKGTPYSTHSFTGYLVRSPEGLTILTWKDGKTVLTLSGQFEEESLLKNYLDLLVNY